MKNNVLKLTVRTLAFLLIFCVLLSLLTMIYLPKRPGTSTESGQVAGFYEEPAHTLDVLYLGSCNMYSSVSPLLIYEKYGITGYAMCCPDQELSTSYRYVKEALKTQDIKVVVIESLLLTQTNSATREHYNRFAIDYLPLNWNKLDLAWELSGREAEHMKQYDPTAPDRLLTFAGYIFPLLRYHARDDLSREDIEECLFNNQYNFYKGGFPQYNYTTNDDLRYTKVFNGDAINEMSRKYVPEIKKLCEEKGIQLVITKSPNRARWGYDDSHTRIVREFAEELGLPFLDYHSPENNNFEPWDYGYETGRLNIYGVVKFSDTMGRFLTEKCGLQPTALSEKDRALWEDCVAQYYAVAEEKGCSIAPGRLAQLFNEDGALCVRWNASDDCGTYSIYRCEGKNGKFELLTDAAEGVVYYDEDVVSGRGYSYYVVPNEGVLAGQPSQTLYYIYLDMPKNFTVRNEDGKLRLNWDKVENASGYRIQRKTGGGFDFTSYDTTTKLTYPNSNVSEGVLHFYRLSASVKEGGKTYYSKSTISWGISQKTPVISGVSSGEGKAVINWKALGNRTEIRIYRRCETEDEFSLIATVSTDKTKYTDSKVEPGLQYFYKIVSYKSTYGYEDVSDESNTVGVKVVK